MLSQSFDPLKYIDPLIKTEILFVAGIGTWTLILIKEELSLLPRGVLNK